jgi:hypothetical protein
VEEMHDPSIGEEEDDDDEEEEEEEEDVWSVRC